ncbi:MAG: NAD(P)/FAD-dependent oxidoreductase [Candidatus Delongbacteria bacterium]|nr:NAD(P)/FAD-dependent oxidoreductase [Candidatus Delongbacteria bacterium]MCG2761474.1 NAD(P)/FAD-dependent oxidoreductase [Candidatus Delongbacteria bacterium]
MRLKDYYDVIVVGGGPGGCVAAKECAEKGLSVLLLERHREIGIPVRCGEAVGAVGLLEFFDKDHWIVKKYKKKFKIRFIAPNGNCLDLNHESEAAILDRKYFDYELGIMASNSGAQIITSANVVGLLTDDGKVEGAQVEYNNKRFEIKSKIVIGADGIESRVGRWAGIKTTPKFNDMESCAQYTISSINIENDRLDFYFGKNVAPTGYLWVFPKGNNTANIGVGVSGMISKKKKAKEYLDEFIDNNYSEISIFNETCGGVICSETLKNISGNGIMLVGDAAHQTNAVTGGGIINAMKAGRIAAEVASESIKVNDVSSKILSSYDKKWHKKQGKANHKFYFVKNIIENIEDETLNSITEKLNKLPFEKRTLINIFKQVLIKHPKIILELPRLFS